MTHFGAQNVLKGSTGLMILIETYLPGQKKVKRIIHRHSSSKIDDIYILGQKNLLFDCQKLPLSPMGLLQLKYHFITLPIMTKYLVTSTAHVFVKITV